eukprot:12598275-Ditylum_brightwellii.AAC.1
MANARALGDCFSVVAGASGVDESKRVRLPWSLVPVAEAMLSYLSLPLSFSLLSLLSLSLRQNIKKD